MRLGDLDALSEKMKGTNRYFDIKFDIDEMPTIDPETLPIVKELRAENKKLTEALGDSFAIDLMNKLDKVEKERNILIDYLDIATQSISDYIGLSVKMEEERDAAIKDLHGECRVCKNRTEYYREGPCVNCKYKCFQDINIDAKDNWKWRGIVEKE